MLTQLRIRTEYSFGTAFGKVEDVVNRLQAIGCQAAAITDRNSTFGHVAWAKLCKQANIKPIFGVELAYADLTMREKRQPLFYKTLLARSNAGLREIYSAVEEATNNKYYVPRLPLDKTFSQDVLVLDNSIPMSDNYMIVPDNRDAYEILIGRGAFNRPQPMHILTADEIGYADFAKADALANECNAELSPATNIKSDNDMPLLDLCLAGAANRNITLSKEYEDRMRYEIDLIQRKNFVDYFKVIADLVQFAKRNMLVGPARGSSCGSLVCYLLGITDIDPIPHGLIFERFIDITRSDLPDIDIDFQDSKRELVFQYLIDKYGNERVGRLGTVNRYKARSAIGDTAKAIKIPPWEAEQIADSIVTRADGDERANFCIYDSLVDTEMQYPNVIVAAKLEGHARHTGKHAAGVIITNEPITNFVSKDADKDILMIDKYDCETINLMKIDCLGLKTLTVINDCLDQIGWSIDRLLAHPLDDVNAYKILQDHLWCGIFQFEGRALQALTRKVSVDRFTDISALTALARPGALISGAAYQWCARRVGNENVSYLHPMLETIAGETYGLVVYQEQMLRIVREIGGLSWPDATLFRRGINKKLGMEYFDATFWDKFREGALANGIEESLARQIWETVSGAGDYVFNKSHSVAYAMVTYWCCVLKSRYPLEFALAVLRHTSDTNPVKQMLRELDRMGYSFKLYDVAKSELNWTVKDGELLGGLTNIKGVGPKKATGIIERREQGILYQSNNIRTSYDDVFECRNKYRHILVDPARYGIVSRLHQLADINESEGNYVFIAKVTKFKIRSLNETKFVLERGGLKVPNDRWLTMELEDDTDYIPATIGRFKYANFGLPMVKNKLGEYYLFRGQIREGNRRIYIEKWKAL